LSDLPLRFDNAAYRSTMGVCLGLRGGLNNALVVVSTHRNDPKRTCYVAHEWEESAISFDNIEAAIRNARDRFHTRFTFGYYGGRDAEKILRILSIRLGHHIEAAPEDPIAPSQVLIDDFRTGRLKAKPDSMVVRDAQHAIWRNGTPDQTGILAALRCAHWAAQQYRPKILPTQDQKRAARDKQRKKRMERPF